jgi:hypothetical protein
MTQSETPGGAEGKLTQTTGLAVAAIVLLVMLLGSVGADIAAKVGTRIVTQENWTDVLNAFLIALLVNSPALIFIGVLGDFAGLFSRTSEGEVFTQRNLKTLRSAGSGLVWAAATSAIVVPTLLSWVQESGRGILWEVNDLAFGTGAMGFAILGLTHVFAEGIRIKTDSDQII